MTGAARAALIGVIAACLLPSSTTSLGAQAASDSAYIRDGYVKRVERVPMRDGIRLLTVIYTPRDAGAARRYPVLLNRTPFSVAPYDSTMPTSLGPDPYMLRDGYVFVQQETRGRYLSEGWFENVRPLLPAAVKRRTPRAADEATDAYDTIEWLLANVSGHNGRVGLIGVSYGGYYAGLAAASRHPAIRVLSLQAPVADFYFEDFHHNGALMLGSIFAYPVFGTPRPAPTATNWWLPAYLRADSLGKGDDYATLLGLGPLRTVTERWYADDVWWREIVRHPDYDAFWRARSLLPHLRGLTVPTLVVGGWFDAENLWGTLASHRALRTTSPAAPLALVMGPFGHRGWGARDVAHTVHGHLSFGDSLATRYQREVEAPFFRAHLAGEARAQASAPRGALVFDTGRPAWRRFERWPAPSARPRAYQLHADGTLSAGAPQPERRFREFPSDPATPVPSRCTGPTIEDGVLHGYMSDDQRCVDGRPDVLSFRSAPLAEDVTFAGPITASIVISTSGTDLDVVVKVIDVYPDDEPDHPHRRDTTVHLAGYQQLVRGEIMRGRYRRSFSSPVPTPPHTPVTIEVPLPDVLHTFRKGHRIMVQVQGTWFPLFDRNPQRYVRSIYEARPADFVAARHRVWVGGRTGSRITATVLP